MHNEEIWGKAFVAFGREKKEQCCEWVFIQQRRELEKGLCSLLNASFSLSSLLRQENEQECSYWPNPFDPEEQKKCYVGRKEKPKDGVRTREMRGRMKDTGREGISQPPAAVSCCVADVAWESSCGNLVQIRSQFTGLFAL